MGSTVHDDRPKYVDGRLVVEGDRAILPDGRHVRIHKVGTAIVMAELRSGTGRHIHAWYAGRLRFVARLAWSRPDAV